MRGWGEGSRFQAGLGPFISAKRRPARRARRSEVGRKEAPSGFCFKAERKHFGAAAFEGLGWGLAAGTRGSGQGLRHLGDLPNLASAGQRLPEGTLPALPTIRPPTPGWGNSLDLKGDQSRGGTSHPGTTFLPLRPSSQLFCFWLLASLGSKMLGGEGGVIFRKKPARHGTHPGKQCGRQKQETG